MLGLLTCVCHCMHACIQAGARLDVQGPNGNTPLHEAAMTGLPLLAKYLLQEGAHACLQNK